LLRRFRRRLGLEPAVIHSRISQGDRLLAWEAVRSGRSRLVVGTRSALFTPMPELGMIILDEEHDASFKQQDGFRYSARDVAIKRAADLDIPVVLGSATPSLESLNNAAAGRYAPAPPASARPQRPCRAGGCWTWRRTPASMAWPQEPWKPSQKPWRGENRSWCSSTAEVGRRC
jgi:primosomal protein N'